MFKRYSGILIVILALSHFGHGVKESYALPNDQQKAAQYHAEGLRLFNQGKYVEAIEIWEKEITLDSKNANTANNIGISYKELGNYEEAIKYHKRALELSPNFGHAYYSLGMAYLFNKEYYLAKESFLKSIQFKYGIGVSYYNLGFVYDHLYEKDSAIYAYEKAIENGYHHNGSCYYALGVNYYDKGDFKKSRDALNKAEKMNPKMEGVCFYKGLAYKGEGWCLRALFELNKAKKYTHPYFIEWTKHYSSTIFEIPEKAGCRDIIMIKYFFAILIPGVFLYFMRYRSKYLKLDWKKGLSFALFLYLIPLPFFYFVLAGFSTTFNTFFLGIEGSLMMEGYSILLGLLITFVHYAILICVDYWIVCILYRVFPFRKASFWIITGLIMITGFFVPQALINDAGGGSRLSKSYFEYLIIFLQDSQAGLFKSSIPTGTEIKDLYLEQLFAPEFPYKSIKVIETKEGKRYIVVKAKEAITDDVQNNYEKETLFKRGVSISRDKNIKDSSLLSSKMMVYRTVSEIPYIVEYSEIEGETLSGNIVEDVVRHDGQYFIIFVNKNIGKVFKKVVVYPEENVLCPEPPFIGKYPGSKSIACYESDKLFNFVFVAKAEAKNIYDYYKDRLKEHYKKAGFNSPESTWETQDLKFPQFGIKISTTDLSKSGSFLDFMKIVMEQDVTQIYHHGPEFKRLSKNSLVPDSGLIFLIKIDKGDKTISDYSFINIYYSIDYDAIKRNSEELKKRYPGNMK